MLSNVLTEPQNECKKSGDHSVQRQITRHDIDKFDISIRLELN